VNLKELSDVKQLVDEVLELLSESLELVGNELGEAPDGAEADATGGDGMDGVAVPGEDVDGGQDPLAVVEANLVRAHAWCADILDITEVHRKRYVAQGGRTQPGPRRATQLAVRGAGAAAAKKEVTNGSATPKRIASRKR